MFDDDDLFDLADDPFEWDVLLDDDELEQDRKKQKDKNAQGKGSNKKDKRSRGLFGGLFGYPPHRCVCILSTSLTRCEMRA